MKSENLEMKNHSRAYFGAGWDFSPVTNPIFEKFNHFIFIDALPKLSHYNPGQCGYEKSKNRRALLKTLRSEALKHDMKFISIRKKTVNI